MELGSKVWIKDCKQRSLIGTNACVYKVVAIHGIDYFCLKRKDGDILPGLFSLTDICEHTDSIEHHYRLHEEVIVSSSFFDFREEARKGFITGIVGTCGKDQSEALYKVNVEVRQFSHWNVNHEQECLHVPEHHLRYDNY